MGPLVSFYKFQLRDAGVWLWTKEVRKGHGVPEHRKEKGNSFGHYVTTDTENDFRNRCGRVPENLYQVPSPVVYRDKSNRVRSTRLFSPQSGLSKLF